MGWGVIMVIEDSFKAQLAHIRPGTNNNNTCYIFTHGFCFVTTSRSASANSGAIADMLWHLWLSASSGVFFSEPLPVYR